MTDAPQAPAPTAPPPSRAAFAFIFVTVLLDMIALGIVVPVLPKLIKSFLNGDTADAAHIVAIIEIATNNSILTSAPQIAKGRRL